MLSYNFTWIRPITEKMINTRVQLFQFFLIESIKTNLTEFNHGWNLTLILSLKAWCWQRRTTRRAHILRSMHYCNFWIMTKDGPTLDPKLSHLVKVQSTGTSLILFYQSRKNTSSRFKNNLNAQMLRELRRTATAERSKKLMIRLIFNTSFTLQLQC